MSLLGFSLTAMLFFNQTATYLFIFCMSSCSVSAKCTACKVIIYKSSHFYGTEYETQAGFGPIGNIKNL